MRARKDSRLARRSILLAAVGAAALIEFGEHAGAATITASWIGGDTGAYSQPVAWSNGAVPNDAGANSYNVFINPTLGAAVEENVNAVTILNLTIGATSSLNFDPGVQFTLLGAPGGGMTTLSNDGTMVLNSGTLSPMTRLLFNGGQAFLNGAGTVTMTPNSEIGGSGAQLTTSNFIHGSGEVFLSSIVNNGTISADSSAGSLLLESSTPGIVNNGLLHAAPGGVLAIEGGATLSNGSGGHKGVTVIIDLGQKSR